MSAVDVMTPVSHVNDAAGVSPRLPKALQRQADDLLLGSVAVSGIGTGKGREGPIQSGVLKDLDGVVLALGGGQGYRDLPRGQLLEQAGHAVVEGAWCMWRR